MSQKIPYITKEKAEQIAQKYPTPFYLYDEAGIRNRARLVNKAFAWNKGFKEYFAVKATPNPYILQILKEEGCGADCSSLTELQMSHAAGLTGRDVMFSSNDAAGQKNGRDHQSGRPDPCGISGTGGGHTRNHLLPL